jgi:DNA-binding CsgD family transcriptional regulator
VTLAGALIGRDSELALLAGLVRGAARGRGGSVLIEGEPGIGKSALMRAAAAGALKAGCEVFWGTGDELSQELPLLPFVDGLRVREASMDPRRGMIVRLLRGEVFADRADVPAVLAEQLLALVAEQCAARPAILVIDDLQWADQVTVALWGRLARSARQVPLLLAGMMRPVPQRDDVLALRRAAGGTVRLQLAALAGPATAELVAALTGGTPDENLLRLADGAAGNPLYLTELVAALARSSSLAITDGGTAAAEAGAAPSSLSAAIADRLGFVTGPVRGVLRAAALLGADFAIADLAIVLGRRVADLLPAIDEACAAGVLAESGAGLGFRHPLIRASLYAEMSGSVRAAWHRDAARALAASGASADRVARQMLRAVSGFHGEPGAMDAVGAMDDWMVEWLARAADPLVGLAPRAAVELLTRAVASSPAGSARRGLLASRLAAALYGAGDWVKAEQVANHALEHAAEPDLLVDLHWTLAQCRLVTGECEDARATLERALASPGISARHRARLLVLVARTHDDLGEVEKAGQVAAGALAAASEAGDSWAMAWALHVQTLVTASHGRTVDALPMFDRALAVTESDPALTDLRLLLQLNKSVALGGLDRCDEALVVARQARDLADQVGTLIRLGQTHSAYAELLYETGRWDDALAELATIHPSLKQPSAACFDLGAAAIMRFHRGEISAARRHLAAAATYAAQLGPHRVIASLVLARSMDREYDGALPEALAVVADVFDGDAEELDELEALMADGVRLAIQAGDLGVAQVIARRAAAYAAVSEIPHSQADALYCRGLLDHEASLLLTAAERYGDASRPLQQAKALEAAAREFVSTGDLRQARAAFTRAMDTYTALGAASDIDRLQAEFRAHGIRRGPRARHRRADSGWASLMPAELKIAGLVEEGLSNPDIAARLLLSPRTVATHVSHILKKLGVHSRIDIARESVLRTITPR